MRESFGCALCALVFGLGVYAVSSPEAVHWEVVSARPSSAPGIRCRRWS